MAGIKIEKDGTELQIFEWGGGTVTFYMDDDLHNKCSIEIGPIEAHGIIEHLKEQFNL